MIPATAANIRAVKEIMSGLTFLRALAAGSHYEIDLVAL